MLSAIDYAFCRNGKTVDDRKANIVFVPKNLPLLVEGNATVPDGWIEATIGYLSQTNQSYKVKIVVLNDSEVTFKDYEE